MKCLPSLLVLALIWAGDVAAQEIRVSLGSQARVQRLFSYPNNCAVICYRDWSLEQTVSHYLQQSLKRDDLAQASVRVSKYKGRLYAHYQGVSRNYGQSLSKLLAAGDLAYAGAEKLRKDGGWQYNWQFFLPLGLALSNRPSVELLHFPPDYSLSKSQDYLDSATTDRWADLLAQNGVDPKATPAYQTIIDIAPIAAPATAGDSLKTTYGYFRDYQTSMVAQLTLAETPGQANRPMVAFGGPVRDWVKQQYGLELTVLGVGTIAPLPGQSVAVLGSNHPSYIWYAADPKNYDGNQAKADAQGLKVMGQDISAACWQASMAAQPSQDATVALNSCTKKWQQTNQQQTCELFYTSIRKLSPEQAAQKCQPSLASLVSPLN